MGGQKNKPSLWFQVEQEIANFLLDRLEEQKITIEHAVQIAKFVVKTIPQQMTDQQMLEIIPKLDDEFTELASIVYKHLQAYELKYKPQVVNYVQKLIKEGKLDEASALMEQYFQKKL